ncbi:13508_t:CDS:2 [Funneliformis geosporum]|uniref:14949_t:CDS:1 n=1 Tax=Funneliformis geosporum TaxID=1117311 RepID=A0A9W4SNK1_9GLOM|nr:13508_t:CDS:2 [Funneliformis geosporum]CAI2176773.1 14949_t:CDS:2 [Funneliformis geosporum]
MSRQIQEYLNSLVNKSRVYYLDLNNQLQKQGYQCATCHQNLAGKCENCNNQNKQLTGEITNLSEFTHLKGVNVSNNQLTNLNFLNTLPNKEQLKGINLFGNQIKEVDFADLFTKFPNLEKINLQNNPVKAKNLNNLTTQQFNRLVQGIKEKKIRVDSFKGTILTDLLTYAQQLTTSGNNQQQQNTQYLQTLIQHENSPNLQPKNNNNSLLIGGLIIFGQLLTSLIAEINKPKPATKKIVRGLSELEQETKKDCSHCQHQKYAEQIRQLNEGK